MAAAFDNWLGGAPLGVIALVVLLAMAAAAAAGGIVCRLIEGRHAPPDGEETRQGYVISSAFGLLALLLGFTFSLAVTRFEARRLLVVDEANAIGTAYLRAQLLEAPHRERMTALLVRYTDNRIALAKAPGPAAATPLLAVNDALLVDIWAAGSAALPTIRDPGLSAVFLTNLNELIDLDATRKAARRARVPTAVYLGLFVYVVISAGMLGYALGGRTRYQGALLLLLFVLVLMLILDIDRPRQGSITEGQASMEELRHSMAQTPPQAFDRWRTPAALPAT